MTKQQEKEDGVLDRYKHSEDYSMLISSA